MPLLTYARYVALTGDSATAVTAVEAQIVIAEREVERFLRRPLAFGTYTESLPVHAYGRAYPRAVPVTSVPVTATYSVEDSRTLRYVSRNDLSGPVGLADFGEWLDGGYDGQYSELYGLATVTYAGGWTATTVPLAVERAIAFIATALLNPGASGVPAGATSISLGGVSVSFGGGTGPTDPIDDLWPSATRSLTMWRWRDGGL